MTAFEMLEHLADVLKRREAEHRKRGLPQDLAAAHEDEALILRLRQEWKKLKAEEKKP